MKKFLPSLFVISLLVSCSKHVAFLPSSVVPSAEGMVKVKTDKNMNYAIKLNVSNLANPGRLEPPKSNYVVWVETSGNGMQNIGSLRTSKATFSKALKSSLETVTAFRPARIFISAEEDIAPQYPGTQVVLTTEGIDLE